MGGLLLTVCYARHSKLRLETPFCATRLTAGFLLPMHWRCTASVTLLPLIQIDKLRTYCYRSTFIVIRCISNKKHPVKLATERAGTDRTACMYSCGQGWCSSHV